MESGARTSSDSGRAGRGSWVPGQADRLAGVVLTRCRWSTDAHWYPSAVVRGPGWLWLGVWEVAARAGVVVDLGHMVQPSGATVSCPAARGHVCEAPVSLPPPGSGHQHPYVPFSSSVTRCTVTQAPPGLSDVCVWCPLHVSALPWRGPCKSTPVPHLLPPGGSFSEPPSTPPSVGSASPAPMWTQDSLTLFVCRQHPLT